MGLVVAGLAALQGWAPDSGGSPMAPELAALMTVVALLIGAWLLLDRQHRHHH